MGEWNFGSWWSERGTLRVRGLFFFPPITDLEAELEDG